MSYFHFPFQAYLLFSKYKDNPSSYYFTNLGRRQGKSRGLLPGKKTRKEQGSEVVCEVWR
jgi:hypothetical protein